MSSSLEPILSEFLTKEELASELRRNVRTGPPAANTTTKDELLSRAKAAMDAGEQSLHDAAAALGLAQEDHDATQREMAEAIGRSASWVNKLLKWRRSGYKDHSPFGPTTKKGRVEHAQQRARHRKHRDPELADFINAVDTLFLKLTWNDQCEAFAYIKKKMAVPCQSKN